MNGALVSGPLLAQALFMFVDEFYFHRKRALPRWERIGHPLDTLTVLACYAVALWLPPSDAHLALYATLAAFSCLFVTKDEFVHARECVPAEQWLHAVLFVLHPVVLGCVGWLWASDGASLGLWTTPRMLLSVQAALTLGFGLYQLLYWNTAWRRVSLDR